MWGSGVPVFLAAALGFFLLQDGPSRMMAFAARPLLVSFLSEPGAETGGSDVLRMASGVQPLSSFLEKEEASLVQAEDDPCYLAALEDENGSGGGAAAVEGILAAGPDGSLGTAGENGAVPNPGETGDGETSSEGNGETQGVAGESGAAAGEAVLAGAAVGPATEIRGTVYTAEQLSDFEFVKKNFFYVHKSTTVYPEQLDAEVLLGTDLTLPESDEPQVLLFHTHGSEGFSDSVEGDPDMTVVGVGNYLAQLLSEQYGIKVIHNTEVFPYSDSYSMALDMLKKTLAEYPSIQVTIDLHRDSGGHEVVDINGKPTAPIMLFNGMCQTPEGPLEDVENPYLAENLAFNFQMKMKAEAYYPGLTLRTFLKAYRYNQHVLPRATLVEVGTENNTYEEAKNAMEPLADILYKVLRGK